ncbi:MAG TPA: Hsp20/alpha crystallin family protein [Opitutaceae bacterium]
MSHFQHRIRPRFDKSEPAIDGYFRPRFEWHDLGSAIEIEVFVPDVDVSGVEMVVEGSDLLVTARRQTPVLTNWQPANLPASRLDYRLRVPLPYDVNPRQVRATLDHGVLTVHLAKSAGRSANRIDAA